MAEEFKRLGRTLKYDGAIVSFHEDTVAVPNGNVVHWDFIHHKGGGAAAVLPVQADGRILMVLQWRNALDRYTLEIPAGGLQVPKEPSREAAARELEEETGYSSDELEFLIRIRVAVAYCDEKIDIYVAHNLQKSRQNLDEDEFIDVKPYTVEELTELIYQGEIEDSKTVAAVMAYKDKYLLHS